MPYIEQTPRRRLFLLLPLCFVACYLVNIWVVELRRGEAFVGTVAREMAANRDFLHTTFQGKEVRTFPLYPALVALCSGLDGPSTFTVRLPSALAVLFTAVICGLFVARRQGRLAGIVTGSMILSTFACLRAGQRAEVGQRAQAETLLMLWMTCAWLSWYVFGQERKRWGRAWAFAMFFVFLGIMTVGTRAIAYFYTPFLFLKLPVRGRRRLLQPYHMVALAGLALALVLWHSAAPGQPFMPWNAEELGTNPEEGMLWDRVLFPVKTFLYLMPWTALAWTPFCVAFRSVERSPVLFHYLRTQIVSLFFVAWLIPWGSPLVLLSALPGLAILTGCHFEILIRRYKHWLERYFSILGVLAVTAASLALLLALCHVTGVVVLVGFPFLVLWCNSGVLLAAAVAAFVALRSPRDCYHPYWLRFMVVVCCLRLVVAAVVPPLEAWGGNERRQLAGVLTGQISAADLHGGFGPISETQVSPSYPGTGVAGAVNGGTGEAAKRPRSPVSWGLPPEAKVVYIARSPLGTESFYLGRLALRADNLERDLPADEPVVYVIGSEDLPIPPSRIWTPVSPVLDSRQRNALTWSWLPTSSCLLRVTVVPRLKVDAEDYRPSILRLYRGDLR